MIGPLSEPSPQSQVTVTILDRMISNVAQDDAGIAFPQPLTCQIRNGWSLSPAIMMRGTNLDFPMSKCGGRVDFDGLYGSRCFLWFGARSSTSFETRPFLGAPQHSCNRH